ncbi:MAG: XRE family transcriptional regulator [Thermodesulfobacteriota bacterium]
MEKNGVPSINVDYFEGLTGELPQNEAGAPGPEVGKRIAEIRKQKGLSLADLSKMTGFSEDLLAGIEDASVQPQLGTIMRLSKALDQALSGMISGTGNKPYEVTRKGERKTVARSTSAKGGKKVYTYQALAHEVEGRSMEPLIVELEEVADPEKSTHEGEEFIFVLSGTARVAIGPDSFDLSPGDCVYYLSSHPHSITGKGGKAVILAVLYE